MRSRLLVTAAALVLLAPATAVAQTTTAGADIYGNGGYSTRPSGLAAGEATGYIFGGVRPTVQIRSSRTTVKLSGEAQFYKYFKSDQVDENYVIRANLTNQFSAAVTGNLQANYSDRVLNRFGNLDGDSDITTGDDASLLGSRTRRRMFDANGGLNARLSSRSYLSGTAFWNGVRYQAAVTASNPSDFDSYGGSLSYQLQTSEHVKLGVQGNYFHSLYDDMRIPESSSIGGAATFDVKFDARWTLQGALGATYRDLTGNATTGPLEDDVLFTGNVSLCYRADRTNLCVHGSRSIGASGTAGSALQGNLGSTLSLRLSEHGTLNADISYFRSSRATTSVGEREYVGGTLGYSHQLAERLFLSSSAFYRKSVSSTNNVQGDDYGGEAGLKYRIGVIQ